MERKGTVLLPCFSYSRTQEILTTLYDIFGKDKNFKYKIVVDSKLSCEVCDIYDEVLTGDDIKLWNKVKSWENVEFISDKEASVFCVKDKSPKIVISSSGFCTNGRILSYLEEYLKDKNSMVIFSGYVGNDQSYLSYRIKNYNDHKTININKKPIANNADCINLSTFSSHANRDELIEFGSSVNCEKVILVHGSEEAKNDLATSLKEAISKKNKTHTVKCSTKDMVIHL
jgi:metallo-beta-lactamase family protein